MPSPHPHSFLWLIKLLLFPMCCAGETEQLAWMEVIHTGNPHKLEAGLVREEAK